jgi:hypothetical protein
VLEQKAVANRRWVAEMGERLTSGRPVARMYRAAGLAWLERQAVIAEQLIAARQAEQAGRSWRQSQ